MLPSRVTKYQRSITGAFSGPNYKGERAVTRSGTGDIATHGRESMFRP
jgi:hypothetical protein